MRPMASPIRLVVLLLLDLTLVSCHQPMSPVPPTARAGQPRVGPAAASIRDEPEVRVRIASSMTAVTLESPATMTVSAAGADSQRAQPRRMDTPVTVSRVSDGFVVRDRSGQGTRWLVQQLRIDAAGSTSIRFEGQAYPGAMVMTATGRERFDLVNHVPMETYLPGVLDRELYASWEPAAFAAQAIAARTYALWERSLQPDRHYDLESTTASQAYGGQVRNAKATEAVRRTRGQVLVYNGNIVPAFYSSSNGGVAQDGVIAFPDKAPDIEPLRGGPRGQWDRPSPYYRWGPVQRDRRQLAQRLAAWGRAHSDAIQQLRDIRQITIRSRNHGGRPAVFTITDQHNRQYHLPAESFRHACNADAPTLSAVSSQQQLRSSFVDVQVRGDVVVFTNGRGFGHGVGLSQWGAQGLAQNGYGPGAIVRYYYPGAQLEKLY